MIYYENIEEIFVKYGDEEAKEYEIKLEEYKKKQEERKTQGYDKSQGDYYP